MKTEIIPGKTLFHTTDKDRAREIEAQGFDPMFLRRGDRYIMFSEREYMKIRREVDFVFDEVAQDLRPGFSKADAIYAHLIFNGGKALSDKSTVVELDVDPSKALVADLNLSNAAFSEWISTHSKRRLYYWARRYWGTSVLLAEYDSVVNPFGKPEVLIMSEGITSIKKAKSSI